MSAIARLLYELAASAGTLDVPGMDREERRRAAQDIVNWLGGRVRIGRPWQLRLDHPPHAYDAVRRLIGTVPELTRAFTIAAEDRLDFSAQVTPEERAATEEYCATVPPFDPVEVDH